MEKGTLWHKLKNKKPEVLMTLSIFHLPLCFIKILEGKTLNARRGFAVELTSVQ